MIDGAVLLGLRAATLAARGAVAARTALGRKHAAPPAEGKLRVLLVAHYPAANAGTRHRLLDWGERLRADGHHVDVALPVVSERGERLYRDWSRAARAEYHLRVLANRVRTVGRAPRYDVAVLHLSDLPHWEYGAPFVARALGRLAGRLLVDLDDLPVIRGETAPPPRAFEVVRAADGVILGNEALRSHFDQRPGWLVPTCVEPARWPLRDRSVRETPVLGWIGTGGRLRPLEALAPVLAAVQRASGARVRVVCDRAPELPGVEVEHVPWSLATEVDEVLGFDIGLAPLDDGPMERCKCGFKVLQYMAAGLPVVASPVGVLGAMVENGRTGLHARGPEEWSQALSRLLGEASLRTELGTRGRAGATELWSYAAHEERFEAALRGRASTW